MATNKFVAAELIKLEYAPIPATGLPQNTAWVEIENIHEDTFKLIENPPNIDPYKDVHGNTYHNDIEAGDVAFEATIGKYDLRTKHILQGGTITAATPTRGATWMPPVSPELIYKAVRGTTKDGVAITFPRAQVVANATDNKKAIGQGVRFIPLRPLDPALRTVIWDDGTPSA